MARELALDQVREGEAQDRRWAPLGLFDVERDPSSLLAGLSYAAVSLPGLLVEQGRFQNYRRIFRHFREPHANFQEYSRLPLSFLKSRQKNRLPDFGLSVYGQSKGEVGHSVHEVIVSISELPGKGLKGARREVKICLLYTSDAADE